MFRDKASAYERILDAISDIGDRIAELEEQVAERFAPRPSRAERMRRAMARSLPSLPASYRPMSSRHLTEFLAGWSMPTMEGARESLRSLGSSARYGVDGARSHLPEFRLPRMASFRGGMKTQRGIDFLRDRPVLTTLLLAGGAVVAVGTAYYVTKKVAEHTEEPDHETVREDGDIEIRDYDAAIVAETVKSGYHEKARRAGFETLSDYIFARNRPGRKIPMTAPVLQQLADDEGRTKGWAIRFVMPKKYTISTLPAPIGSDVRLKEMPARRVVAIRFSGSFNATLASRKLMDLYNYLADENLKQKGDPEYAFYNPPWTPGFMRRNEILIEIER